MMIVFIIENHKYLRSILEEYDEKEFYDLLHERADQINLKSSLMFISELLRKFHNHKIYILIDQYDAPVNDMIAKQRPPKEIEQVSEFISTLLSSALKGNHENVQKGFLTGIFDVIKKNYSGLNNITVYGITDPVLSQFYGFTSQEIREFLITPMFKDGTSKEQVQTLTDLLMEQITLWYNGYLTGKGEKVYNSYAVIRYLSSVATNQEFREGESYWQKTASDALLKNIFSFSYNKNYLSKLISLVSPRFIGSHTVPLPFQEMENLESLDFSNNISEEKLTMLLIDSGYLTGKIQRTAKDQDQFFLPELPNKET